MRNQQAFLKALFSKTTSAKTLSNPVTINNMVQSIAPFITVDKTLDAGTLVRLGFELRHTRNQDVYMFTLPTNGTGTSSDGQSIVLQNPEAMARISEALISDTLGQYIQANNFERATNPLYLGGTPADSGAFICRAASTNCILENSLSAAPDHASLRSGSTVGKQ